MRADRDVSDRCREGEEAGFEGGARWLMTHGVALHLLVEENLSYSRGHDTRVMGILDLAFRPEM